MMMIICHFCFWWDPIRFSKRPWPFRSLCTYSRSINLPIFLIQTACHSFFGSFSLCERAFLCRFFFFFMVKFNTKIHPLKIYSNIIRYTWIGWMLKILSLSLCLGCVRVYLMLKQNWNTETNSKMRQKIISKRKCEIANEHDLKIQRRKKNIMHK